MTHTDVTNAIPAKPQPSNLTQRILTSVVLAPLVVIAVVAGGWPFALVVALAAVIATLEFYVLARNRPEQGLALVGVPTVVGLMLTVQLGHAELWPVVLGACVLVTLLIELIRHPTEPRRMLRQLGMTLFGVVYVGFPAAFLIAIRGFEHGTMWLLLVLSLTWGTDIMAYIGGRMWGRTPLAPRISPKKTVEGAVAGYLGGTLTSLLIVVVGQQLSLGVLILIAVGPLVAILGDLFESALKRFFQVKDSHLSGFNVLPGHGGVLDRIDALIWVTALCYFAIPLIQLPGSLPL